MLDTLIAVLIEKGLDGKAKSTESALLRDALRERLAREVRLNLALWKLPASKPRPQAFAAMVSRDAFDAVCTLNLPLRLILDVNGLAAEAKALLEAGPESLFGNLYINNLRNRSWHHEYQITPRAAIFAC